jgi:hypothetical protein
MRKHEHFSFPSLVGIESKGHRTSVSGSSAIITQGRITSSYQPKPHAWAPWHKKAQAIYPDKFRFGKFCGLRLSGDGKKSHLQKIFRKSSRNLQVILMFGSPVR